MLSKNTEWLLSNLRVNNFEVMCCNLYHIHAYLKNHLELNKSGIFLIVILNYILCNYLLETLKDCCVKQPEKEGLGCVDAEFMSRCYSGRQSCNQSRHQCERCCHVEWWCTEAPLSRPLIDSGNNSEGFLTKVWGKTEGDRGRGGWIVVTSEGGRCRRLNAWGYCNPELLLPPTLAQDRWRLHRHSL